MLIKRGRNGNRPKGSKKKGNNQSKKKAGDSKKPATAKAKANNQMDIDDLVKLGWTGEIEQIESEEVKLKPEAETSNEEDYDLDEDFESLGFAY